MSHVLVPLAQGCEELEAITITDLLVRAGVDVTTCGLDDQPVKASRGTIIVPDVSIDEVVDTNFDMIVLPGGQPGADHLRDDARVQAIIKRHAQAGRYIGAICAAPRALARAGLLSGRKVTSYPGALDEVDDDSIERCNEATVIDGNVITSMGPGTAMDFALSLIELLEGREKRDAVEIQLVRC